MKKLKENWKKGLAAFLVVLALVVSQMDTSAAELEECMRRIHVDIFFEPGVSHQEQSRQLQKMAERACKEFLGRR